MIYGHEAIRERLQKDLKEGTLHPALLFAGPDGIGKRMVADELWKSQFGEVAGDPQTVYRLAPDGKANIFKKDDIVGGVDALDPGLFVWMNYVPPEGLNKWCLVEQAHQLSAKSGTLVPGNLFLKVLEEPPKGGRFILFSNRPEQILPTLRSRTLRIDFKLLTEDQVRKIADELGITDPRWIELNQGAIEYPKDVDFQLALAQIEAWCRLLRGESLGTAGQALLQKETTLGVGEQIRKPLDLLLRVMNDAVRNRCGKPVRMSSFQKLLPERIDLGVADRAFQALKWLGRNPKPESVFRFVLEKSK